MRKDDFINEHVKLISIFETSIKFLQMFLSGRATNGTILIQSAIELLQNEYDDQLKELQKISKKNKNTE